MSSGKIKAIYGTRDILPRDADIWRRVISSVSRQAEYYNYGFIHTPIFEVTELFSRGMGETSDVVTKEMYTFKDQGNRSITLRPEATASVVRAYLEHSMAANQGLVKVWYAGPMFRQERPQAGRYRQFYQFGIEAIGSLDSSIDAEVIILNYRIFQDLGIDDMTLYINSIGMPEDRVAHKEAFEKFAKPKLGSFCRDCNRRYLANPLRMFDCKEKGCQYLLKDAPVVFDYLSDENLAHFRKITEYLELVGIPYRVDQRLVRGLDYYTRTAWEIKSAKLGSQDSISGGGRYDLLTEQLGGPPTPGIGFAAGIERVILAMPEEKNIRGKGKIGFYIAVRDEEFKPEAFRLMTAIRGIGIQADIDYLGRSLKAQMKQADKSGLGYVIILAEDELGRGAVAIRNMKSSMQFEMKLGDIYKMKDAHEFGEIIGKHER